MKNMTVSELNEKLETKENLLLLDVREFNELSIASVVGVHHVP
jgi:rhodanese-related sulfurtransferase